MLANLLLHQRHCSGCRVAFSALLLRLSAWMAAKRLLCPALRKGCQGAGMAAVIAAASPSCNPRAALATYPGTGLLGWPVGKAKLGLVQRSYHRTDNINLHSAICTSSLHTLMSSSLCAVQWRLMSDTTAPRDGPADKSVSPRGRN